MTKHKLALALALTALISITATSAADPMDDWQPGAYFNMTFGGPEKSNGYRFGAKMSLSEQAVNKIYGGNTLLRAHRALKGEGAGELPAYLTFDFNSGKDFTAQWLGMDVYRYDYVTRTADSPLAMSFLGPFNAADSWAIIVTGGVIGAAGLGYGISQWTSSTPAAGGTALLANGAACVAGAECASGICCGVVCAAECE